MNTRESYFKFKYNCVESRGLQGYVVKEGENILNPWQTMALCYTDDDEANIDRMSEIENVTGFMFWVNDPKFLELWSRIKWMFEDEEQF